jgi:hypothetical protein
MVTLLGIMFFFPWLQILIISLLVWCIIELCTEEKTNVIYICQCDDKE